MFRGHSRRYESLWRGSREFCKKIMLQALLFSLEEKCCINNGNPYLPYLTYSKLSRDRPAITGLPLYIVCTTNYTTRQAIKINDKTWNKYRINDNWILKANFFSILATPTLLSSTIDGRQKKKKNFKIRIVAETIYSYSSNIILAMLRGYRHFYELYVFLSGISSTERILSGK